MENGFLQGVARLQYKIYGDSVKDNIYVFPSRRSMLFFRKYLGRSAAKPLFSPQMYTVDDLLTKLSGWRRADRIESLYLLYREYARISGSDESFDEFIGWGEVILADFDDVDKYLADPAKVFANVKDLKDIDFGYDFLSEEQREALSTFWGVFVEKEQTSEAKRRFRRSWEILAPLYEAFHKSLSGRGIATAGMIYRHVAELVEKGDANLREAFKGSKQIVFVGLNALNACERKLLKALDNGILGLAADFYWDYGGKWLTDKTNKASLFISELVKLFPSKHKLEGVEPPCNPHIKVIASPSNIAQAKIAGSLLEGSDALADDESTAIILPDSNLLSPLMNSIPENIDSINITMGSSVRLSSVYSFMNLLASLQRGQRTRSGHRCYYHRDVENLLRHELLGRSEAATALMEKMVGGAMMYPEADWIVAEAESAGDEAVAKVFRPVTGWRDAAAWQLDAVETVQKFASPIDKEYLFFYYKAITRMQKLDVEMEVKTYFKLLSSIVCSQSVTFLGEPLGGLQIMGPLETRGIDFDNVIITSMNEGVFPSNNASPSFIPYNVRKGFNLPTYELLDSISAYHFYRSIGRAKSVTFIYCSSASGVKTGEESRWIKQLKYGYDADIEEVVAATKLSSDEPSQTAPIPKDDEVMRRLHKLFFEPQEGRQNPKPFSASLLNEYLDCPLKFYHKEVEGISIPEEIEENMEASTFGTIYHDTMETLYKPLCGKVIEEAKLMEMSRDEANIERILDRKFLEDARVSKITGRNHIVKRLLKEYVVQTLRSDAKKAPLTMVSTEVGLTKRLHTKAGDVTVYGKIDRIDIKDGTLRILDYKTGKVGKSWKEISDMFNPELKDRPHIPFQLQLYNWLFEHNESRFSGYTYNGVESAVFSLMGLWEESPLKDVECSDPFTLNEFGNRLTALVEEILDSKVQFVPTNVEEHCTYCDFKILCNRYNSKKQW